MELLTIFLKGGRKMEETTSSVEEALDALILKEHNNECDLTGEDRQQTVDNIKELMKVRTEAFKARKDAEERVQKRIFEDESKKLDRILEERKLELENDSKKLDRILEERKLELELSKLEDAKKEELWNKIFKGVEIGVGLLTLGVEVAIIGTTFKFEETGVKTSSIWRGIPKIFSKKRK